MRKCGVEPQSGRGKGGSTHCRPSGVVPAAGGDREPVGHSCVAGSTASPPPLKPHAGLISAIVAALTDHQHHQQSIRLSDTWLLQMLVWAAQHRVGHPCPLAPHVSTCRGTATGSNCRPPLEVARQRSPQQCVHNPPPRLHWHA